MKHTDYLKKKKNREIRRRLISVLSALVVFVATYALVLPALTLDVNTARMEPGMSVQQEADPEAVSAPEASQEEGAVEEEPAKEEEPVEAEEPEKEEESVKEESEKEDQSAQAEEQAAAEGSSEEKADAEQKEDAAQADAAYGTDAAAAGKDSSSNEAASDQAIDQAGTEGSEDAAADAFKAPELEAIDFDEILTDKTDFYYYHEEISEEEGSEDTSKKAAVSSTDVQDWKKVKEDTILAPEDFVRVYLAYTIPAGALNETNTVARYRIPEGLELTDKQIKAINKNENGISGKDKDAADYKRYLGAEAIEGTRTPDQILKAGTEEYISATVKVEKVYDEDGKYLGQDLIFTFVPYTVQKNQIGYDEKGNVKSEGKAVKGWFSFDLTPSRIGFEEVEKEAADDKANEEADNELVRSQAKITFVKENEKKDIDEISRELTMEGPAGAMANKDQEEDADQAEQKTLTYEGTDYTVIINYTDDAQIPYNAELAVSEIEKDTDEYNEYLKQAENAVDEDKTVNEARFFDITILANGEKIEPAAPVSVQINFAGIEQTKAEDAQLLHYKDSEEVEVMDKAEFSKSEESENDAKAVDIVQFETDGFSVYGIVGTELKKEITLTTPDSEDVTYVVSVTYGPEANIPDGARLEVTEFDKESEEYQTAYQKVVEFKKNNVDGFSEEGLRFEAIDITIIDSEGLPVEPEAAVQVKITRKGLPEDINDDELAKSLEVQHIVEKDEETQVEVVAIAGSEENTVAVTNGDIVADFSTDSFSTYILQWGGRERRIHYGYMDDTGWHEFTNGEEGNFSFTLPTARGQQINLCRDIEGYQYVSTRINSVNGTRISPFLQTEAVIFNNNNENTSINNVRYWMYRELGNQTTSYSNTGWNSGWNLNYGDNYYGRVDNTGLNNWVQFGDVQDIYVEYRTKPIGEASDDDDPTDQELEAPKTNKNVQSNGDGTYDVSLDVTGKSVQSTDRSRANVVIVIDTSYSMLGLDGRTTDHYNYSMSRMGIAKDAIAGTDGLIEKLLSNNANDKPGDPATIELAFVDFAARVRNESNANTIYTDINAAKNWVNNLTVANGTNWDHAFWQADHILWNDNDPVYIIFVSDGTPNARSTIYNDHSSNWDGATYTANDSRSTIAEMVAAAAAKANASSATVYTIGAFENPENLKQLSGADRYYSADDKTGLTAAFDKIISDIQKNLGYEDVTIHDGITAMTSISLINGTVDQFHYSVRKKDGTTKEYADGAALQEDYPDIGLASYADKQVTWELGDQYMLEDGVTYTVSFTVWPSQEAYDYLADFSNGVKDITEQSTDTKKQFFVQVGSSIYQYVANKGWTTDIPAKDTSVFITDSQMREAIDAASSVTYYLRTNTSATVDYTSVKIVDGVETERKTVTGSEIKDPNGKMVLDSSKMKVAKEFAHDINSASPYTKLNFYLKRDGKYYNKDGTTSDELDLEKIYTIELPKNNNWWDEIFIAPGLIEKETGKDPTLPPLEAGHDYSVEEKIITGNVFEYEFTPQTVRPMVIGTTLTFLVKKDKYNTNSGNAKEYELPNVVGSGTSIYYVASENNGSLIGTNRKTSELDITKVITGVDVDENRQIKVSDPRYNESFTYRVTLSVPADGDPSGIMGYEYVPRLSDPVNGTTRVNIYGYQEDTGSTTYEPDTTRFKGRTYGAWNTQAYKYFVETYTDGSQILVRRDEDGNFSWLENGDGISAAKKEVIDGKEYYSITLDVTIKMDEVYRFNNLPSGTKYKIQEIYWNKYKADGGSAARTIVSDNSNIDDSGYDININTTGSVSTTDVENDTVSGTIEELDTRYYNQFENTLSDEPDIIQLQVTKHLQGYNWSGERYYFRLSAIDGAPMPASLNEQLYISSSSGSDDKSYAFGYIRFTAPGTYQYKITELDPATAGISGYTAVDGVTGYGVEKTITITVDEDLKVTEVTGVDTTFANKLVNTTFTNTKGILVQLLKLGDGIFSRPLDGVTFELYEDQACTKKVTKDVLGNDIGINGVITTADGGMADLGTLKTGTYYLKETGTVDGYNKLTDLISVEVKADGTVTYNQPSYTDSYKGPDLVYQDENGDYYYYSKIRGDETDQYADSSEYTLVGYRIVVSNSSGVELPHTGGPGTLPYTLGGIALIMASALMYGFRMRRRERRSK